MGATNHVTFEFPAIAQNVEFARVAVACFASQIDSFTVEEIDDIKLIVSEAVSNVVLHGYDNPGGPVRIRASIDGEVLTVTVEDSGRGIADVEQARRPAFTTSPDRMGMGFTIMEALSDTLDVWSRPGAGVRVTMTKAPRMAGSEEHGPRS
ncbi:MAG: anti-sigma F factor [Firmicutes bacterium]|nr:anti-sigma F factor [Bacillota bacterium]HHY33623.1 anti-sigma F factor [Bacillota bacterium]